MRLLRIGSAGELRVTDDVAGPHPPYAILSHTWGAAKDEISFEDVRAQIHSTKSSYAKLKYCANQTHADGLEYCWIDTCCINKSSSAELSEGINSMYQWYENAAVCYVYLADIDSVDQLERCAYFTRGWTLQELIAPAKVAFYNRKWKPLGTKHGLQERLSKITGVPTRILRGKSPRDCSVAQRMSWAAKRKTSRPEDIAYCLLGLFDINMSMLYGEGTKAFKRLQLEIMQVSDDHSILAWRRDDADSQDLLASSPADYETCANVVSTDTTAMPEPYSMTNVGLSISLSMIPWAMHTYLAVLDCQDQTLQKDLMPQWREDAARNRLGIFLQLTHRDGQFIRVALSGQQTYTVRPDDISSGMMKQRVLILQHPRILSSGAPKEHLMYGFLFRNVLDHRIMSRAAPQKRTWSSGLTVYSVLRGAISNEREVILVNLSSGERGLVSVLETFTTTATADIVLLEFGFDYNFNPVCRLRNCATGAEHAAHRGQLNQLLHDKDHVDKWMQEIEQQHVHDASAELHPFEVGDHYQELPRSRAGPIDCTFRGSRRQGLHGRFPELNFQVSIVQGLESQNRKAWIVDIESLALEGRLPNWQDTHAYLGLGSEREATAQPNY